jgi:hypothetical protein
MRKITLLGIIATLLVFVLPPMWLVGLEAIYGISLNYSPPTYDFVSEYIDGIIYIGGAAIFVFWFVWVVKKIGVK